MDSRVLSRKAIIEAIERNSYEFTGITESGEVVLAIVSDDEKRLLNNILNSDIENSQKLKSINKLRSLKGRSAQEYKQIYLQSTVTENEACKANGLRLK